MRLVSPDLWPILTLVGEFEGEHYSVKLKGAEVIRDRAKHKYNCDGTIEDACLHRLQFSCWNASDPGRLRMVRADQDHPAVADCVKAWNEAKTGTSTANGALLYYATTIPPPAWVRGCDLVAEDGKTRFYKPKVWTP